MKVCTKCKIEKSLSEFYIDKTRKSGFSFYCKICHQEISKRSAKKNPQRRLDYERKWRSENKGKIVVRKRAWKLNNSDKIRLQNKIWEVENRERRRKTHQSWDGKNREKRRSLDKKYRSTPEGIINHRMKGAIQKALHGNKAGRHWESLIGYTLEELKQHLELKFTKGMSWSNMGRWHIDHIIPKSFFTYDKQEDQEFQYCWSLDNLQPLWAKDNLSKNSKILGREQK